MNYDIENYEYFMIITENKKKISLYIFFRFDINEASIRSDTLHTF